MKKIIAAVITASLLFTGLCGISWAEDVRTNVHCGDVNSRSPRSDNFDYIFTEDV